MDDSQKKLSDIDGNIGTIIWVCFGHFQPWNACSSSKYLVPVAQKRFCVSWHVPGVVLLQQVGLPSLFRAGLRLGNFQHFAEVLPHDAEPKEELLEERLHLGEQGGLPGDHVHGGGGLRGPGGSADAGPGLRALETRKSESRSREENWHRQLLHRNPERYTETFSQKVHT